MNKKDRKSFYWPCTVMLFLTACTQSFSEVGRPNSELRGPVTSNFKQRPPPSSTVVEMISPQDYRLYSVPVEKSEDYACAGWIVPVSLHGEEVPPQIRCNRPPQQGTRPAASQPQGMPPNKLGLILNVEHARFEARIRGDLKQEFLLDDISQALRSTP